MVSEQFHPRQEVVASDWVGISDPRKIPSRWRSVTADRPSSVSGYGGAPAYRPSSLSGYGGAPVVRPSSLSEQGYPRQQMVWSDWCGWYVPRKPPKFLPALAADRPYTLPSYGGGPDRSVGNECLGAIGLGSSACKIPSRFQSRSVELAPAREPHLLRQVRDPSDLRRRLGSAELSGGLERRLVKVPGSILGKIPKPCDDLGKMAKSVVTYEEDASDPTAVWRVAHVRPSEEPRNESFLIQPREMETTRRSDELRRINLTSTQEIQPRGAPEGNLKPPLTGLSEVDEVFGKHEVRLEEVIDGLDGAVSGNFGIPSWLFRTPDYMAPGQWNHQKPSQGPDLAKQWLQNPRGHLNPSQFQYPARQWNSNSSSDRAPSFFKSLAKGPILDSPEFVGGEPLVGAVVQKKETEMKSFTPGACKYCGYKGFSGHKCKQNQHVDLIASEVIVGPDCAGLNMKKGEVALVTIPPEDAIGFTELNQDLAVIPTNSTWIQEVELVLIVKDKESVYALAMNDTGNLLVPGGIEQVVHVWDPGTGSKNMKWQSSPLGVGGGLTFGVVSTAGRAQPHQILDMTDDEADFHMRQGAFLYNFDAQMLPKGYHCFSRRLMLEYSKFSSLDSDEPFACKLNDPKHRNTYKQVYVHVLNYEAILWEKLPKLSMQQLYFVSLLWNLPPWPDSSFGEVHWVAMVDQYKFKNRNGRKLKRKLKWEAMVDLSFLEQYEAILKRKLKWEAYNDLHSYYSKLVLLSGLPFEEQLVELCIIPMFQAFQDEIKQLMYVLCEELDRRGNSITYMASELIQGRKDDCTVEYNKADKNVGASPVKHITNATNDTAGDGTTSATVLSKTIFTEWYKSVAVGVNLKNFESQMLGSYRRVTVTKDNTVILDGAGDRKSIEERKEQIRSAIEQRTTDHDKERLQERLAKLSGGIVVFKIRGSSEVKVVEKKDGVTDALIAIKAAVEEGIVLGGGVALFYASKKPQLTTCDPHAKCIITSSDSSQEVEAGKDIMFTYDVDFKESDIRVAMIMLLTLYQDISKYNQLETQEEAQEETGWNLVHSDVFRPPSNADWLCVYVGTGVQFFGMLLVTLVLAVLSFLSPSNRGGLMTAMFLLVFMRLHGWAVTLSSFAKMMERFWGENYFDPTTKKWNIKHTGSATCRRGFVQSYYEPIKQIIRTCMNDQKDNLWPMLRKLGVTMKTYEKELMGKTLIKSVMQTWLSASTALLEMMIIHLPFPSKAQEYHVENLYEGSLDDTYSTAVRNCDQEGPFMLYDCKLIPASDKDKFFAFGRAFSGEVAAGLKVRILGPKYVLGQKKDLYVKYVQSTAIWRGKKRVSDENIPCGNSVVRLGLYQFVTRNAILTNEKVGDACPISTMEFPVFPIVRVAVQCKFAYDLSKLVESSEHLAKPDLRVLCTREESGEHIIAGTGELTLKLLEGSTEDATWEDAECMLVAFLNFYSQTKKKIGSLITTLEDKLFVKGEGMSESGIYICECLGKTLSEK